ncbi:MAG: caspase family protein [Bacteroidia bacterium]|nr:caspase family protein [Bacteroidia bacterium]
MARKLFALLVGIDEYPYASDLKGCVNDISNMEAYLKGREDLNSEILCLRNEEASKDNIVNGIQTHLGKAGPEDISLFYFAGHGVEEATEIKAFQQASNTKNLQTFLCYNSDPERSQEASYTCLADKEVRYLIQELNQKGSDIYFITDCCHSGESTRFSGVDRVRKFGSDAIKARDWKGFIFHDKLNIEDLQSKALPEVIPLPRIVHMSACRNVEVAWEAKDKEGESGGLFSISLLRILKESGPNISIKSLQSQIRNYLRSWENKKQTPQFFINSEDSGKKHRGFLGAEIEPEPYQSQITYNPSEGWVIGMGSIHGIDTLARAVPCNIYVGEEKKEKLSTHLSKVFPAHSVIKVKNEWELNQDQSYPCEVKIEINPLPVFLDTHKEQAEKIIMEVKEEMKDILGSDYIEFVSEESAAKYSVRFSEKEYKICLPFDQKDLVLPTTIRQSVSANYLLFLLSRIANWEFVKQINNPKTNLQQGLDPKWQGKPIELLITSYDSLGNSQKLEEEGEEYIFNLNQGEGYDRFLDVQMTLYNRSSKDLYVSLTYLTRSFGISNMLGAQSILIPSGGNYHVGEGAIIGMSLQKFVYLDKWAGSQEHILLVASLDPFDLNDVEQNALPTPYESGHRKFKFKKAPDAQPNASWIAYTTNIFIVNPDHKKEIT